MSEKKFIAGILITAMVLLGGGFYLASNLSQTSQIEKIEGTKASVEKTTHDWGKIGMNDGDVSVVFNISNKGAKPLKLFNVKTSCMCTTAQLIFKDKKSPVFGMHTKSSYVLEVPSNETAKLKVTFDPAYHGPQGVGSITRQILVQTNDPENPELNFEANALVSK